MASVAMTMRAFRRFSTYSILAARSLHHVGVLRHVSDYWCGSAELTYLIINVIQNYEIIST